jgi:hypothetical protein
MRGVSCKGKHRSENLETGRVKLRTKRVATTDSGELSELTSFIQSSNLAQSSQYVTVLRKEQGAEIWCWSENKCLVGSPSLPIRICEAVFVNRKVLHVDKALFVTGFLSFSCNFNAVAI